MAGKDPRIERSIVELRELYDDQLKMLVDRCDAYYEGKHHEARSIATILHNLLYDRGRSSKSILGQLGITDQHRYLDSRVHNNLTVASVRGAWPRTCIPYSPYNENNICDFDEWWTKQSFQIQYKNIVFTRKELVETIRNMEGGSHVDSKINEKIAALKRTKSRWTSSIKEEIDGSQSMTILFRGGDESDEKELHGKEIYGFELASICAIGEELLFSLTPEPENRKRMQDEHFQKPYYLTAEESESCKDILRMDLQKLNLLLNEELSPVQAALAESARQILTNALRIESLTSKDFDVRYGVARLMKQAELSWNSDDE